MDVIIVGSVALDDVKTPAGEVKNALGGSAVYASISASYYAAPGIVGVVGHDFSDANINLLKKHGISSEGLEKTEGRTFHWAGYYKNDMGTAYTVDTQLNVFATFSPKIPQTYQKAPFLFLANIDPDLQLNVLQAMKQSRFVMLDTMNLWIETKREALLKVIQQVDMMMVNDAEARQLSGESNLFAAARWIQSLGPKGVVIKKGEHGALLLWEKEMGTLPAYPVETVKDPTGAGDTFAGGMIGALAQQKEVNIKTLKMAASIGTVMASFTVEDFSVNRLAGLTKKDIFDRHKKLKQLSLIDEVTLDIVSPAI